jgi:hypothetical protein
MRNKASTKRRLRDSQTPLSYRRKFTLPGIAGRPGMRVAPEAVGTWAARSDLLCDLIDRCAAVAKSRCFPDQMLARSAIE